MADSESGSSAARGAANDFTLPLDHYLKGRPDGAFAAELSAQDGGAIDVWLKRIETFRAGTEPPYDAALGQYSALADALALRLNMAVDVLYPQDFVDPAKSDSYASYWENRLQPHLAAMSGPSGEFVRTAAQIAKPIPGMTRKQAARERGRIAGQRQQGKKSLSRWGNGHKSNPARHAAALESGKRADAILKRLKKESEKKGKGKNKPGADASDASDTEPKASPISMVGEVSTKFFRCPVPSVAAYFSARKEPEIDGFSPGWFAAKAMGAEVKAHGIRLDNFRGPFDILNGIAEPDAHIDAEGRPSMSLRLLAVIVGAPAETLVKEWQATLAALRKRAAPKEKKPGSPGEPA